MDGMREINMSREEKSVESRRDSNNSKQQQKRVGRRRESNTNKSKNDDKSTDTKASESVKRKRSSSEEENKKKKCVQRYPPLGLGGVAWVYPGTDVAVKTGDTAHFEMKSKLGQEVWVGEIVLRVMIDDTPQVKVCLFYRPEQTPQGRQKHHSEAELIASGHHELVHLDSLVDKVTVYDTVEAYDEGVRSRGSHEYFYRFFYNHVTRKCVAMDNQTMERYCVCESIYNPDLLMLQCNSCQRWYHTSCLNISKSKARALPTYVCPSCCSSSASCSPHPSTADKDSNVICNNILFL